MIELLIPKMERIWLGGQIKTYYNTGKYDGTAQRNMVRVRSKFVSVRNGASPWDDGKELIHACEEYLKHFESTQIGPAPSKMVEWLTDELLRLKLYEQGKTTK